MKNWRLKLRELLKNEGLSSLAPTSRGLLISAIQEFSEELKLNGRNIFFETSDDSIVLKVISKSGLELDLVIKGIDEMTVSLFSPQTTVSDFRIGSIMGHSKEQIAESLLSLYSGILRPKAKTEWTDRRKAA